MSLTGEPEQTTIDCERCGFETPVRGGMLSASVRVEKWLIETTFFVQKGGGPRPPFCHDCLCDMAALALSAMREEFIRVSDPADDELLD